MAFLIGGNWKLNLTKESISPLVAAINECTTSFEVVVAPPSPYLDFVRTIASPEKVQVAAQNIHEAASGAFTGEQSAAMVLDVGCSYVILGHSERRHVFGEGDAQVGAKCKAALDAGLKVILCVGEKEAERDAGETLSVLTRQLSSALEATGSAAWTPERLVIAYEPVWAIGTGKAATPAIAQTAHHQIREWLASVSEQAAGVRIIYGGSVKPQNCASLAGEKDIDGFLIGGASLKAESFIGIIEGSKVKGAL